VIGDKPGRLVGRSLADSSTCWCSGADLLDLLDAQRGTDFGFGVVVLTVDTHRTAPYSHVSSVPNNRAETPESVCPELETPESAFSNSSQKQMHGAIASMIFKTEKGTGVFSGGG